jgi:hypothetical protein
LKNRKEGEKIKNMKNNKFCVSRTLVYLVLLVAVLVGGVYMVRSINQQQLGKNAKAAGNTFDCGSISGGVSGRNIYIKIVKGVKKYYKDAGYKYEITEGVGNYCKANITNPTTCINVGHLLNCKSKRPVYKKGTYYYANSSCTLMIVTAEDSGYKLADDTNILSVPYCRSTNGISFPFKFGCPNSQEITLFYDPNATSSKKYYFISAPKQKKVYVDEFGIGNHCIIDANAYGTPYPKNTPGFYNARVEVRCSDFLSGILDNNNPKVYVAISDLIQYSLNPLSQNIFYESRYGGVAKKISDICPVSKSP